MYYDGQAPLCVGAYAGTYVLWWPGLGPYTRVTNNWRGFIWLNEPIITIAISIKQKAANKILIYSS